MALNKCIPLSHFFLVRDNLPYIINKECNSRMRRFNTTKSLNAVLNSSNFLTIYLSSVFMLHTLTDGRFPTKILYAFLASPP